MTTESIECAVARFLEHKRALGRKYVSEQAELRLLVRFAATSATGSASGERSSRPSPRSDAHTRCIPSDRCSTAIPRG